MYCPNCGSPNEDYASFCTGCGKTMKKSLSMETKKYQPQYSSSNTAQNKSYGGEYAYGKSPVMAMILSLFIVGLGQLYNGDNKKGAYMLIGAIIAGILSVGIAWFVIAIYSAVDAYQVANGDKPLWKD